MSENIKIGLIGFGSVGKQLYNVLLENGYADEQIYIYADDHAFSDADRRYPLNDFKLDKFRDIHFIPTMGYLSKHIKYQLLNYLIDNNYHIFTFIHPTAFVSTNAKIGRGVIIYPLCNIDQGAVIDDGAIILNSSIVAHDTYVGKCVYVAPGVCMSGFINIGELSFIGSGAVIANNITLGKNCTVAMGTCLTKSIPDDACVIGNPFQIKQNIKLY
ncbi:acetyltransferase [Mucilaginibacter phyllosphaerae]|uniref:Acetyltransferase n=1 Tax=Mucilaginibacter phyllosphaerae TaxID=1812349 RepID=A0A4Y8AG47_9SPHI|nr:acetyltransferase [Mucilaginibacter phyllosphaerae]MBB3968639.1 sugar O-acyltransferase (sialic acid O-acetyltransferase NeuD family) [Mucilaginibacter phyllosphaerae]TEW67723.1 acetyltransferase [Mucilaginibacter phyllosphaerae]GGH14770.1 GDP-perosamine N-acetyltransferase [Mucilaginibacter phyllosphaerae]